MTRRTRNITAEELLQMPDDGLRRELVRGESRTMTPAGHPRGRVAVRITWPLSQHVEENGLGAVYAADTGFVLETDPDTVRERPTSHSSAASASKR
jgi:hypothetical protein